MSAKPFISMDGHIYYVLIIVPLSYMMTVSAGGFNVVNHI